jgi:hypothetical protein
MTADRSIALVIDPRFPGGTSSAVAQEIRTLAPLLPLQVHAISSAMFPGREVAPVLAQAMDAMHLTLTWDSPRISAGLVVVHNPSFLKFDTAFVPRIVARDLVVVTHENISRPAGVDAFDMERCLGFIDRSSLALRKQLAPVSNINRDIARDWLAKSRFTGWGLTADDWHNICSFVLSSPTGSPTDRRGRHSRPGFEKFPSLAAMDMCFPRHAVSNVILGGDTLIADGVSRPHWQLVPFLGCHSRPIST